MELALTIIAGIGILLFLIGYLAFVTAGFKHHFVTGLISVFPILNIVTIPALLPVTGKKLMLSFLGVIIAGASWFMGADKGLNKTLALIKGDNSQDTVIAASSPQASRPINTNKVKISATGNTTISAAAATAPNQTKAAMPYANKQRFVDDNNLQGLPTKALYRMAFEAVPVNQITRLNGRVVQITTNNNEDLEGRISKVSNSSVFIQTSGSIENELPIANIKQLRLMIKKAN